MITEKEKKYLETLTGTRDEYIEQEDQLKKKITYSSYISAICLVAIPVATFWNVFDGGLVILLTAIIAFCEFYIKFNKINQKLDLLNYVITNLNIEYYRYYYECKDYSDEKDREKMFQMFVERTTDTIKAIELQLNNKFDMEAIKKIKYDEKDY